MWITYKNTLLVIGGGVLQLPVFKICEDMGLGTLLVDGDPNCWCSKRQYFDKEFFINASIKEPEVVLSQVRKWLKKYPRIKLAGVYTQGCDCAYTVAYVAYKLGLPSIGIDTAFKAHDKIAMRELFHEHGIPQPLFYRRPDMAFIKCAFPVVVKPSDNCASRGITIVRNPSELSEAIEVAKKLSSSHNYIIEEFIDGREYSVDTVVYRGRVYPGGISDRIFQTKDNYAIQDGSITPSLLPTEKQEKIYWIMQKCADALQLEWGALKGDIIIDDDGHIFVLEVTTRLSGGFDSQYRKPYSLGINLIKATIDLACGNPLDFNDLIPKWVKYSQTFSVFPKEGVIKDIVGLEELKKIDGIKNVFLTKKIGDTVNYKNCADRVIHIIATGETFNELQETVKRAKETIRFITE